MSPLDRTGWSVILFYYLLALALCLFGAYNAYAGPLSSEAWQCWSGSIAYRREFMRALVFCILGFVVLQKCPEIFPDNEKQKSNGGQEGRTFKLLPNELSGIICVCVILLVILGGIMTVGLQFKQGLSEKCEVSVTNEFRQIWLPYIPYFIYVAGLWIGIAFFTLRLFYLAAEVNWYNLRQGREELYGIIERVFKAPTSRDIDVLWHQYFRFLERLKLFLGKILWLGMSILLLVLHEMYTTASESVTETAINIGIYIGVLIVLTAVVTTGLIWNDINNANNKIKQTLEGLGYNPAVVTNEALLSKIIEHHGWSVRNLTKVNITFTIVKDSSLFIYIAFFILLQIDISDFTEFITQLAPEFIEKFFQWAYDVPS